MHRVCRGGFPEAVLADSDADRRDFFTDYLRTVTARDVRLIREIADLTGLRRLVRLTAARTAGELARQLTWSDTGATLMHWSDRGGAEVDLLLEATDGRVVAIEVKAAKDVNEADSRWLRTLRDRLGPDFVVGVVLHCGDHPRSLGDRLVSLPITALWSPA